MHKQVLVIGNVIQDVYLRLDKNNHFELDRNQTAWLDLAFNGSSHNYFDRTPIYGAASISLEILSRFGHQAQLSGSRAQFTDGAFKPDETQTIYRYILSYENHCSYLSSSMRHRSPWQTPQTAPDWIYIDRSAELTPKTTAQILAYLNANPLVKLALHVNKHQTSQTDHVADLIARAHFIINETATEINPSQPRAMLATLTPTTLRFGDYEINYRATSKDELTTRLNTNTLLATSLFAAHLAGKTPREALLLTVINLDQSRLGSCRNLASLEPLLNDYQHQLINLKGNSDMSEIETNAKRLVAPGKGILAADESGGSIHKKFESMAIPDDEQHRRDYRNLFFTTPDLEQYASGVILFDETARQFADDGSTFVEFLNNKDILAGIKVDQGLEPINGGNEKYTKGLEGLPERLAEYYAMGARFAKWRAAFEVTESSPSDEAIQMNAEILAKYAVDCQAANIVPIVEPELVYAGDYTLEQSIHFTSKILDALFIELNKYSVNLAGCILKVNMVLAGKLQAQQSTPEEVGAATAQVLRDHVPEALAGVVFLSGGQTVTQATDNLQQVTNNGPFPWPITFSYARALQDPALQAWRGDNNNADAARYAFRERLIANANALVKNN